MIPLVATEPMPAPPDAVEPVPAPPGAVEPVPAPPDAVEPMPAPAVLRAVARGGLAGLAGTALAGLAGLGVTWLVARTLDPAAAGAFFSALAVFALGVAGAKLGSQTSMVYWPARLRATGDRAALLRCLRVGLVPVALASVLVAATLWSVAERLPGVGGRPGFAEQLRALAVFLPAAALTDATLASTRGMRRLSPTIALDRVLRPAGQLALLAGCWLTGAAPAVLAAAWAAPYLPVALLSGYALRRLLRTTAVPAPATPSPTGPSPAGPSPAGPSPAAVDPGLTAGVAPFGARVFWAFSAPRALASVGQLALQRVDVLLVAALSGLAPAALYAVASRFMVLGQFVNQGVSQAVQPRLAERLALADLAGARALYQQSTAWLVLVNWPLYLLVLTYAGGYLRLFGPRYAGGTSVVVILALAMLVATACGMVDMVLAMGGRTWWNLANVGLALTVLLGVDLVLVPRLGVAGAAAGLAGAVLANNLVPLAQVSRTLRLHPFGRATLVAAALAVGCFAVPPLILWLIMWLIGAGTPPLAASLAVTAAGAAGYLYGAARLRTTLMRGER